MANRIRERATVSPYELPETIIGGMHTCSTKRASTSTSHSTSLVHRTDIAGWFFDTDSDNDDTSGKCYTQEGDNGNANMVMNGTMKERVYELEKECTSMKQDLDKLVKTKEGRSFFSKLFGLRSKTKTSPGDKDGLMKE